MHYSIYYFLQPFQLLLMAALMGFLIHRLRQLPPSVWIKTLIILIGLASLGCLLSAVNGFIDFGAAPMDHSSQRLSFRQIIRFIASLLTPFANEFCLIALTVLVCQPARTTAKKVLTPEERYQQT